jgi:uncharacterized membrane protein YhhN
VITVGIVVLAAVAAFIDWWAVATDRRSVELVAKPLTMAILVVVAATVGDPAGDVRRWLVVGAVCGLIGDIALLGDGESAFMGGLAAFAVGHLAYVVAAIASEFDPWWAVPGIAFVVALLGVRFLTRTLPGAIEHGGRVLGAAVLFYAVVISAMVVTAWATTSWIAAVGAMLFAVSDWVLGHRRFVGPLPGGRLAIMVPYHVGQALLIIGIGLA